MEDIFGLIIKVVLVLSFVILFFISGTLLWRKFFTSTWNTTKRLKVIEILSIDPKRKLVLVKFDDQEHLLLVGGSTDLLVSRSDDTTPMQQFSFDKERFVRAS